MLCLECDLGGGLRAALRSYDEALRLLTLPFASETGPPTSHQQDPWSSGGGGGIKEERALLMNATLLNGALAASKRGDHKVCEGYCTSVLERRPGGDDCNVKALFRRGRARVALERWDEAEDDLARAERLDQSLAREVAVERRRVKKGRAAGDASMGAAFKKVFGGGGSGGGSGRVTYTDVAEVMAGPGMTPAMAAAEMAALDLAAGGGIDGVADQNDPRAIADYAVARAVQQEYNNETSFRNSVGLYSC
jgi:hypothetical protein